MRQRPVYRAVNVDVVGFLCRSDYYTNKDLGLLLRRIRTAMVAGDDVMLDSVEWLGKRYREPLPRAGLSPAIRAAVQLRDGNRCVQCRSSERLEVDHITPVVHGGSDNMDNLQLLCRTCNRQKGPRPHERARMRAAL